MEGDTNHLYFIFVFLKGPHTEIITFAKDTFKDIIRKDIFQLQ